jgi:hypothetical protein
VRYFLILSGFFVFPCFVRYHGENQRVKGTEINFFSFLRKQKSLFLRFAPLDPPILSVMWGSQVKRKAQHANAHPDNGETERKMKGDRKK